jgi:hypothetical protein
MNATQIGATVTVERLFVQCPHDKGPLILRACHPLPCGLLPLFLSIARLSIPGKRHRCRQDRKSSRHATPDLLACRRRSGKPTGADPRSGSTGGSGGGFLPGRCRSSRIRCPGVPRRRTEREILAAVPAVLRSAQCGEADQPGLRKVSGVSTRNPFWQPAPARRRCGGVLAGGHPHRGGASSPGPNSTWTRAPWRIPVGAGQGRHQDRKSRRGRDLLGDLGRSRWCALRPAP